MSLKIVLNWFFVWEIRPVFRFLHQYRNRYRRLYNPLVTRIRTQVAIPAWHPSKYAARVPQIGDRSGAGWRSSRSGFRRPQRQQGFRCAGCSVLGCSQFLTPVSVRSSAKPLSGTLMVILCPRVAIMLHVPGVMGISNQPCESARPVTYASSLRVAKTPAPS